MGFRKKLGTILTEKDYPTFLNRGGEKRMSWRIHGSKAAKERKELGFKRGKHEESKLKRRPKKAGVLGPQRIAKNNRKQGDLLPVQV